MLNDLKKLLRTSMERTGEKQLIEKRKYCFLTERSNGKKNSNNSIIRF